MKLQKGFTLIELLVVIAIIGILATIVLASVGDVRTSAKNTAAIASMNQIRTQAEVYSFQNNNSYTNLCTQEKIIGLINSASRKTQGVVVTNSNVLNYCKTDGSGSGYISYMPLKDEGTQTGVAFCVDSQSSAEKVALAQAQTSFSGTTYKCPTPLP